MKRNRPRTRSSHRSQRSGRPKDRSAFFQKPKLYSQATYIGPIDVEPFSSFKGSHVADGDAEEEGFPTALCRVLGCWQTEPHSHDLPRRLEIGIAPQAPKPYNSNRNGIIKNKQDNPFLVGRPSPRPPSPLVAGPACLSERIVESLPAPSHYRLGKGPTKPPCDPPRKSYSPPPSSSILQPALGGTRDLRDALPPYSTSNETSHVRVSRPSTWQVSLPIHPKPSMKRKYEGAKALETEPSPKRQDVMLPTAPPNRRILRDPPQCWKSEE